MKRIVVTALIITALPYSLSLSEHTGIALSNNEAQAVIGRPATPRSFAGAARRAYRRGYYYHGGYYARPYVRHGYYVHRTHPYIRRGYYGGY